MLTATFNLIVTAINSNKAAGPTGPFKAVFAKYANYDRKLVPYAVGTASSVEMVFCYQYADGQTPTHVAAPHTKIKNFRCFKVAGLGGAAESPFTESWTPMTLPLKKFKKQNCIDLENIAASCFIGP